MFAQAMVYWIRKSSLRGPVGARPLCRFYLINPERNASVNSTVKQLIGIGGVEEVYVTEGPHGFIVKAKPAANSKRMTNSIAKKLGGQIDVMTSYAKYRK